MSNARPSLCSIVSLLFSCMLLLSFTPNLLYSQSFANKQSLPTGPQPYGIKAADVNSDEKADLIWFSSNHNIEIRLVEATALSRTQVRYMTACSVPPPAFARMRKS
jgi:hypothetical protein